MDIRIAGTVDDSIVDGPGFRYTVFTQGCSHHCPGCHNPETHDFAGGRTVDTDAIVAQMRANPLLDGLTLSGGDPMEQPAPCAELARQAGSQKAVNVVLIGALARRVGGDAEIWRDAVRACVPPKFLEINLRAFDAGYNR